MKTLTALLSLLAITFSATALAGNLSGLVEDMNGQPLPGYPVTIHDQSGRSLTAFTANDGRFYIYQLMAGTYQISVNGLQKVSEQVTLETSNSKVEAPPIKVIPAP